MNQEIITFPMPKTGKVSLVNAPRAVVPSLMTMLAALALRGRVIVIDSGNCFDGYMLTRALRRETHEVPAALRRVLLSRAFTCYQTVAMLVELPENSTPVMILDMLSTFLDENVQLTRRLRLLDSSLSLIRRISTNAPIAIWTRVRTFPTDEDKQLLAPLLEVAHDIWEFQTPTRLSYQLPLF